MEQAKRNQWEGEPDGAERWNRAGRAGNDGTGPMVQTDPVAFTVKLTAKDLWKFSLYHSNKGMLGIFNVISAWRPSFCWLPPGVQHGDVPGTACCLRADVHCVAAVSPVSEGGQAV